MPILAVTRGEGGLAQNQTSQVQVKWQSFQASCGVGLHNKTRFINSAGFWAHTALVLADAANASDVIFGPTGNAATRLLPAGSEYLIPAVYPMINNSWAVFDLGDWWFCCAANPAVITIMYV